MTALVQVDDLVVRYGPAVALDGVSLTLGAGERVALIGANGAGKSSLLNAVCGVVRPAEGTVRVAGDDVTGGTPNHVVRRGRPIGGLLGQEPHDQVRQLNGNLRVERARRRRLLDNQRAENGGRAVARERSAAGRHPV